MAHAELAQPETVPSGRRSLIHRPEKGPAVPPNFTIMAQTLFKLNHLRLLLPCIVCKLCMLCSCNLVPYCHQCSPSRPCFGVAMYYILVARTKTILARRPALNEQRF